MTSAKEATRSGPPPFKPGIPAWLDGWDWRGISGVAGLQAFAASLGNDDASRAVVNQCIAILRAQKPRPPGVGA